MKSYLYDLLSLALIGLSIYFFFRSVDFLVSNDYIGSVITMLMGFMIIWVGVQMSRIAQLTEIDPSRRS